MCVDTVVPFRREQNLYNFIVAASQPRFAARRTAASRCVRVYVYGFFRKENTYVFISCIKNRYLWQNICEYIVAERLNYNCINETVHCEYGRSFGREGSIRW